METTTIKIYKDTKLELDSFRQYKNESYDEILKKTLFIVKNFKKQPQLSKQTLNSIEEARERMKKGNFLTETQVKKRLGLNV